MKTTFRSRVQRLLAHANSIRAADAARASRAQGTAQILRFPDGGLVRTRERAAMAQVFRGRRPSTDEPAHAFPCGSATQSHRDRRASLRLVQGGRSEDRDRVPPGRAWRAALVAATVGCILSTSAHAQSFFQIESGIGGSAYSQGPDGYWVQDGFEHKLNLTAPAIEAGVTGDIYQAAHWGVSYHLDWAWLGAIHTQSLATPQDSTYNLATKRCNGPCGNIANFVGAGHEQGFLLTIEPHYDAGKWRFGIEAGPFLHHASWSETVTGWSPSPTSPMRSNFTVNSTAGWRIGAVVGAEASRGPFSIVYQHFFLKASGTDAVPPIWHSVDMIFARYKF